MLLYKCIMILACVMSLSGCIMFTGEKYKVKTKVVAVDFTGELEIYKTIAGAIEGLEIGVLGMEHKFFFEFLS